MSLTVSGAVALLKFSKREFLQQFRNEGLLYMNPMAYFQRVDSNMARADTFEGTTWIYQPKDIGKLTFDAGGLGCRKLHANPAELAKPVLIGLSKTAACNIYCMFAVSKPVDSELVSGENLQFGDSFVTVFNTREFLSRVVAASKDAGFNYLKAGPVEYYDGEKYSGETGRFRKRSMFAYQNEYRIVVEPGVDTARKLIVGSLRDITSEVLPLSEVNQILDFSTKSAQRAGLTFA
jgi:hypothetical protein